MRYIAGLFAVSSFALLVFGFPASVDAAICAFVKDGEIESCADDANGAISDAQCTAMYNMTVPQIGSYQSQGFTKVFDTNIATCEEYESSITQSDINTSAITGSLTQLNKLSANSIPELIGKGLRLFTGFFGSIALIMVIYGGLQIMTAAGQSEKIKQGGKIIAWASIGLITMMLSYLLVSFVFGAIA